MKSGVVGSWTECMKVKVRKVLSTGRGHATSGRGGGSSGNGGSVDKEERILFQFTMGQDLSELGEIICKTVHNILVPDLGVGPSPCGGGKRKRGVTRLTPSCWNWTTCFKISNELSSTFCLYQVKLPVRQSMSIIGKKLSFGGRDRTDLNIIGREKSTHD